VKVLKSGDTEGRAELIGKWASNGMDVLMTNPKKVEVGMDLLEFPSIIFYQIPMSTYTLRQASRRSWRIPQKKPVRVYFFTYLGTMQTRLMQLMASKLTSILAKKVTHIEITGGDLEKMLGEANNPVQAQFSLF